MSAHAQPDEDRGLVCPRCGCRHFYVVYTRPRPRGEILRRRECRHCGRRIITIESQVGDKKVPPV
jgi:transcriptional regulator NrdR family protein